MAANITAPAVSHIHGGTPSVLATALIGSVVARGESDEVTVEVIVTGGPTGGVTPVRTTTVLTTEPPGRVRYEVAPGSVRVAVLRTVDVLCAVVVAVEVVVSVAVAVAVVVSVAVSVAVTVAVSVTGGGVTVTVVVAVSVTVTSAGAAAPAWPSAGPNRTRAAGPVAKITATPTAGRTLRTFMRPPS
jgi:hypothetical protein